MRKHLSRPSPALVVASVALFVALGGTGYAAATGSIDSREIKNSTIRGKDVKNSSLTGGDVKTSGLTGSDVKADSLTGSDLSESSLGKVPSATSADTAQSATSAGNANTVGGQGPAQLRSVAAFNQNAAVVGNLGTTFVPVSAATITTQATSLISATGAADLDGATGQSEGSCRLLIDGVGSLNYEAASDDIGAPDPMSIAVTFARSLPAGTYAVVLQCRAVTVAPANVGKDDASVSVIATPTG